jgi:uncharacterized membrane protein
MVGGLLALLLPLLRAWTADNVDHQLLALEEADTAKVVLLVPGAILTGITGFVWAVQQEYDFITTGWLLTLIFVYLFAVAFCLPLVNLGLRRVQLLAMQAQKKGEGATPELREALADNVPLVFGLIMLATVPVMAWLPIFKPF